MQLTKLKKFIFIDKINFIENGGRIKKEGRKNIEIQLISELRRKTKGWER